MQNATLIQGLGDGPIDIIGDVHGEIEALRELVKHLGYSDAAVHPEGRTLVFVGDLCDRGPDSPAVVDWVGNHIDAGRVKAVLGNHELSVLRGLRKDGNDWFFGEISPGGERYGGMRMLPSSEQANVLKFFNAMPLVLERDDIRIVHAAWDSASIEALRSCTGSVMDSFQRFEDEMRTDPNKTVVRLAGEAEKSLHRSGLKDRDYPMPPLAAASRWDEMRQMANPIRVVTSGFEKATAKPFYAGGVWRFVQREAWWDHYHESLPVVFGHYWRRIEGEPATPYGPYGKNLFYGIESQAWFGRQGQAFCVDYSVGGRYAERLRGQTHHFWGRLGALRVPEAELVLDDGRRFSTQAG